MMRSIFSTIALAALFTLAPMAAMADTTVTSDDWGDDWGGSGPGGLGVGFVATPTAAFSQLRLTLSTPDSDATIFWTLDAAADSWTAYTTPITFTSDATVTFYASRGEGCESERQTFTHFYADYQASAPALSLSDDGKQLLMHTAEPQGVIRYTLDGSEPTTSSAVCQGAILLPEESVTIKARVFAPDLYASDVADYTYTYVAPEEPGEDPENPGEDPENPGEDPENPGEDPENPGEDPENPGEDPENPGEDPENPGEDPENPGEDPENPGEDPENPGEGPDPRSGVAEVAYAAPSVAFAVESGMAGLTATAPVTVSIYDMRGRMVATLSLDSGFNPLPTLPAGIYICNGGVKFSL